MLKVLHIVLGLQVGGLEKFVLDLTDSYQANVQSTILCLADPHAQYEIATNAEIIRWDKGAGFSLSWALKISRLVKKGQYDLIHTHNPSPHFYGSIAGLLTRVPVVHTKHGRNYPGSFKKVLLNRIASQLSQRIVAVSTDAADVCRQIEKIPASKVQTILNGVDVERFFPGSQGTLRDELQIGDHIPLLGIVARLSSEKNHRLLLDTCQILKSNGSLFHLAIIGDGPLREDLEQGVITRNLEGSVTFLGMRQDIPKLVRAFDVFVLSSRTEGVSLTLLEAMSCCVPVVATDVGGNPEVVVDGVTGFIVPQDAKALAQKIKVFIQDAGLREMMGKAGRERVLAKFTLIKAAELYLDLYNSVVVGRRHD